MLLRFRNNSERDRRGFVLQISYYTNLTKMSGRLGDINSKENTKKNKNSRFMKNHKMVTSNNGWTTSLQK